MFTRNKIANAGHLLKPQQPLASSGAHLQRGYFPRRARGGHAPELQLLRAIHSPGVRGTRMDDVYLVGLSLGLVKLKSFHSRKIKTAYFVVCSYLSLIQFGSFPNWARVDAVRLHRTASYSLQCFTSLFFLPYWLLWRYHTRALNKRTGWEFPTISDFNCNLARTDGEPFFMISHWMNPDALTSEGLVTLNRSPTRSYQFFLYRFVNA
jgi:hypothetical protein